MHPALLHNSRLRCPLKEQERPDRRIRRLYLIALGSLAALITATQLAEHRSAARWGDIGPTVNVAGRQRMLSQQIVKCALAMAESTDREKRFERSVEMEEALRSLRRAHAGLQSGDEAFGGGAPPPGTVRVLFERVEPAFERITESASALLSRSRTSDEALLADAEARAALTTLLEHEAAFVRLMDQIVYAWNEHASLARSGAARVEAALVLMTLLVLALEALFIFEPAARTIGRQVDALRGARRKAEEASRAKSAFLANMSHEIRTPMTAILGYADLLASEETTSEKRAETASIIRRNGEHLMAIINDILDLSKLEAGMLRMAPVACSPSEILEDVRSMMAGRAAEAGLALVVERRGSLPASVRTDPVRLRQILVNLVGNAVKFTPSGQVRIVAEAESEEKAGRMSLRFTIADSGVGIHAEAMETLFTPFMQADASTTRKFGGTGLGLAISQHLAKALGGRIEAESTPGEGSVFTLTISADVVEDARAEGTDRGEERAAEVGAVKALLEGVRVLLAEDGVDNQRLLAHYLRRAGAAVTLVANGRLCVERIEAEGPEAFDVVLMDMQMPEMDGYEATRRLRAAGVALPIAALTAHAMRGDRERCLKAGCDAYMTKPVAREDLIALVASMARGGADAGAARSAA